MQRQKTIAKWLVIILLLTVAVGAYIIYDAVYEGASGGAAADDTRPPSSDTGETPLPSDPVDDEEETPPSPPYYTFLPRPTQNYAGIEVAHAGGEGYETVLGAVFTADARYIFFSSTSEEYDCRGGGLYAAVITDGKLIAVTRFADADCTFGGAKLTSGGVAVAVSDNEKGSLLLFAANGTVKGETELPAFRNAFLLLSGKDLEIFLSDGSALMSCSVDASLSVTRSPFRHAGAYAVKEGFSAGGSFTLIAEDERDTAVLSYSHERGFISKKVYEKTRFMQIVPLAGEDGAALCMLGGREDGVILSVLGLDGEEEAATVVEGSSEAALFGDGVSVTLVRTGLTETYCRHLDLISSEPTDLAVGEILAVKESGDDRVILSVDGEDRMDILLSSKGGGFLSVAECDYAGCNAVCELIGGELVTVFSTTSDEGIFFERFGGADAYSVSIPL